MCLFRSLPSTAITAFRHLSATLVEGLTLDRPSHVAPIECYSTCEVVPVILLCCICGYTHTHTVIISHRLSPRFGRREKRGAGQRRDGRVGGEHAAAAGADGAADGQTDHSEGEGLRRCLSCAFACGAVARGRDTPPFVALPLPLCHRLMPLLAVLHYPRRILGKSTMRILSQSGQMAI